MLVPFLVQNKMTLPLKKNGAQLDTLSWALHSAMLLLHGPLRILSPQRMHLCAIGGMIRGMHMLAVRYFS